MPYIEIKAYPGRTEEIKVQAIEAILEAALKTMGAPKEAFTILYEEVAPENWQAEVVDKAVKPREELVYVQRGEIIK